MNENREIQVTLTGVFEATSLVSAVEQFREWMVTGVRTVTVEDLNDPNEQGWSEVSI